MWKLSYILVNIIWLLTILPIISSLNVAIFMPCLPSHISPHFGIIRELLYQNHSVVCILNRECHEKLNHLQVDFVHNDGVSLETVLKKDDIVQGAMSILSSLQMIISSHTTIHQDVLDYFESNKIDVIFSSVILLSANHIADKFNIPLLIHTYSLGFLLREKCGDCEYIGTVVPLSPYSSLSPSLPVILFSKLFEELLTLALYPCLVTYDTQRKLLGLEETYPRSLLHYNLARFPLIYQNYHPLVPPSIDLPDGRWLVGYIPHDNTRRELSEEYLTFLREDSLPVVYISFGTVVKLSEDELSTLYQQVSISNGFKVILALRTEQQLKMVDSLELSNLNELISEIPEHVKLVKFAPQKELLLTEEVKLFVSHGGFSSVMESILSSTPLILFPLMSDQFHNSNVMEEIGCAIQFSDMTKLSSNILAILENYQRYKACMENAKQLMSKAGGAVEVVEILERLSSHGYKGMSFDYQIQNIPNVYSALLTVISIPISIMSPLFCLCYCCCCRRQKKASKVKDE